MTYQPSDDASILEAVVELIKLADEIEGLVLDVRSNLRHVQAKLRTVSSKAAQQALYGLDLIGPQANAAAEVAEEYRAGSSGCQWCRASIEHSETDCS